jgi:hypothetical protein
MASRPKFTGDLAKPIRTALQLPGAAGDGTRILPPDYRVMIEHWRKLELLFEHYGIAERSGSSAWFCLAYRLACDCVPGFQAVYDDPIARALKLPNAVPRHGPPRKLPEWMPDEILKKFADLYVREGIAADVSNASEIIACAIEPELAKPHNSTERKKRAKTIQNKVSTARKRG